MRPDVGGGKHADLEEAHGYIFGSFREGFGPLKLFPLPFPPGTIGVGSTKAGKKKREEVGSRQKALIRPVVLIKLRGVIF